MVFLNLIERKSQNLDAKYFRLIEEKRAFYDECEKMMNSVSGDVVGDIALSQTREVIERILDSIKYWELLLRKHVWFWEIEITLKWVACFMLVMNKIIKVCKN